MFFRHLCGMSDYLRKDRERMSKVETLKKYFESVEEEKKQFAFDTIEEYCFFLDRIEELKKLPYIQVKDGNPEMQRLTPAAKLIKEYSQIIDAKRGTLLRILNQEESSAADDLLAKLSEFE